MKYIVLVPDGMADTPLKELNDRTCMEAANAPNMDMIARKGVVGMVKNIPRGMTPASDVANLSILGYAPQEYYCGRGPLEAANLGVDLTESDVAFRFNTVTVAADRMVDYSAGHITTKETSILVDQLDRELGNEMYRFYAGTSYRNLLVAHCDSPEEADRLSKVRCYPPHDILDKSVSRHLPKHRGLVGLMERSKGILEGHDINRVRIDLGQNPANMIWIWGQGKKPDMPGFEDAYGISGGMISAVDLLKGLGHILGLEVGEVPGATGYYDTDYEGKARAALDILQRRDMVFVHVEAPDEAGHNGEVMEKIKAIENFDRKITGRIIGELSERKCDYRVLILPDHPTPVKKRTHTSDPVPFAIAGKGVVPDNVTVFTEKAAKAGSMAVNQGSELMRFLLTLEA
ncbi:MAG: cofactor-independent phosphoglycerate mutase [Candidatus Makaraimicrobium thalassicum]|nr:MAG: cofactor-independent phosphoglycerate mutase [Candidatus Omnitrophota bacterium]